MKKKKEMIPFQSFKDIPVVLGWCDRIHKDATQVRTLSHMLAHLEPLHGYRGTQESYTVTQHHKTVVLQLIID